VLHCWPFYNQSLVKRGEILFAYDFLDMLYCMIPYFQKYLAISSKLHDMKWPIYNHFLVRSGELLLEFDIINNWDAELKKR